MADNEQKALELMAEAEKKLHSPKGRFDSLFGDSTTVDDAIACYQRAAISFKMAKKWAAAGNAYCKAGALHAKAGSRHEAATAYVDAANCYKKSDPNDTVTCQLKAIEIYTDMGRFTLAAKLHQSIAELYGGGHCGVGSIGVGVDLERAIFHYEQAAEYFSGEQSNSAANKCLLKVAQYAAQLEKYEKAVQIYEQVAAAALQNTLLKYSASKYYFCAALCHLCIDLVNAEQALQRYQDQYPGFEDSRECKLLKVLIDHMEEEDVEAFTKAVKQYDSISRLEPWYTTMLLRVKKQIDDNSDLRTGGVLVLGKGPGGLVDGVDDTSDGEDNDKEEEGNAEEEEKENDGRAEEEPLNSEDDVSDEDPTDLFDTDNVVV